MPGDADLAGAAPFGEREREYLESLPAVREVRGGRIYYSRAFREQCVQRYMDGESPVMLFREAGLDPKLIGYKRIERAFARWTRTPVGGLNASKTRANRKATAGAATGDVDASARENSDAAGMNAGVSAGVAGASSGMDADSNVSASRSSRRSHSSSFARPRVSRDDARDHLIARQALRISELEDQLAQLRQTTQSPTSAPGSPEVKAD